MAVLSNQGEKLYNQETRNSQSCQSHANTHKYDCAFLVVHEHEHIFIALFCVFFIFRVPVVSLISTSNTLLTLSKRCEHSFMMTHAIA